jgi:putative Mg2+ transporter-C (MgtC) family protein
MISPEETILRLVVAAVLGGLVGLERERLEWAAGMRTHALVSLGSALFMVVSIFGFSDILNERHVILDSSPQGRPPSWPSPSSSSPSR